MVRIYKAGFPGESKAALNNSRFVLGQLFQELSLPSLTRFPALLAALLLLVLALFPAPAAAGAWDYPTPGGYAALLEREPDLAFPGPGQAAGTWEPDLLLLKLVNLFANAARYQADPAALDAWGEGQDCDDYVVAKLRLLRRAGVPRGALRMTAARVNGRAHLVLVVADRWVLDSLTDRLYTTFDWPGELVAGEAAGGWRRWSQPAGLAALLP